MVTGSGNSYIFLDSFASWKCFSMIKKQDEILIWKTWNTREFRVKYLVANALSGVFLTRFPIIGTAAVFFLVRIDPTRRLAEWTTFLPSRSIQ